MTFRRTLPAALVVAWSLSSGRPAPTNETFPPVAGSVTLDGKPMAGGRIIFYLTDGEFVGTKLKAGKYKLTRLPAGTWRVGIEGEGVPARYGSEETTQLIVEVREGSNNLDFDLRK